MKDRIVEPFYYQKPNGERGQGFRPKGISELTDSYLVYALRGMEATHPERSASLDDYVGLADAGYIAAVEDIEDDRSLRNYEVFKIEAETRGLVWRLV